jgi:hypothetical protein
MTSPDTAPKPFALKSSAALVAALAVLLAITHLGTIAAHRQSLQASLAASDISTTIEHVTARESLLMATANGAGLDRDVRAEMLGEAMRLREKGGAGEGLDALEARHTALRAQAQSAATRAGGLGLGEAGLGLAILLIAVGDMLGSVALRRLGLGLGVAGIMAGLAAVLGV